MRDAYLIAKKNTAAQQNRTGMEWGSRPAYTVYCNRWDSPCGGDPPLQSEYQNRHLAASPWQYGLSRNRKI